MGPAIPTAGLLGINQNGALKGAKLAVQL